MARRNPDYSDEEGARQKAGAAVLARYKETIQTGMAEALWVNAYIDWADENREDADDQLGRAKAGQDWYDVVLANDLPKAAEKAAADLYKLYEETNGNLVELFGLAETADLGEDFSFYETEGKDRRLEQQWKLSDAGDFGRSLADMALGSGASWFDNHKEFAYEKVRFECHYDGEELTWSGGTSDVREATRRIGRIVVVNDPSFYRHSYILVFRAGTDVTYLLIGAEGIDSAIDELIDWVAENEPDYIATARVNEEYRRIMLEGGHDPLDYDSTESQEALEEAAADTTQGGNASDYIDADAWMIVAEDPTEDQIQKIGYARNPDQFSIPGVTANPAPKKGTELREPWNGGTHIVVKHDQHGISGWLEGTNGHRLPISFGADRPTTLREAMASARKFLRRTQGAGGGMVNPAGRFTAKGERMYKAIEHAYGTNRRGKEIAARTVQKVGRKVPGLLKQNCGCTNPAKPNPSRAELADVAQLQKMIREALDSEFAQKVNAIDLRPSPSGKQKTLDDFKRDLSANLAQALVLDEEE